MTDKFDLDPDFARPQIITPDVARLIGQVVRLQMERDQLLRSLKQLSEVAGRTWWVRRDGDVLAQAEAVIRQLEAPQEVISDND